LEAAAAPAARTSKLSLHFPWGKNKDKDKAKSSKKDKNAPAASSAHPQDGEESGDLEGVQQLVGMGFPRDQAVLALEANDFDVQRALNSLLSA
jgi:epidermal growth factor receptor substrate 15